MKKLITLLALSSLMVTLKAQSYNIGTYAGNGYTGCAYSGDGGQATSAEICTPNGVTLDSHGNIYIDDVGNQRIRKVNTSGIITTIAGNGYTSGGYTGDGGPATSAEIFLPIQINSGIAVDNTGNVYFADPNNNIVRVVNTSGIINTYAGNYNGGTPGYSGDGGAATAAEMDEPLGITLDASGNMYIADESNDVVRKVTSAGIISTYAGNYNAGLGYSGDGGPATSAEFHYPVDVALGASGTLYVSDFVNNLIRKINSSGTISTYAGNYSLGRGYSGDGGPATDAQMDNQTGIATDAVGDLYISDGGNAVVREVNSSGIINSVVGNSAYGYTGDGGPATNAELTVPTGISTNSAGTEVFIADYYNNVIRSSVVCGLSATSGVVQNVLCNGEHNGDAKVTVSGNFSPVKYTYSWSNGSSTVSTADSTGAILSAGTYTVTIKNYYGCVASNIVTITQPLLLMANASVSTAITCNGDNNGIVKSVPSGGTAPFTYSWSGGGGTNATITGLSGGTFTVTVSDSHGCTATSSVSISQPPVLNANATTVANVSCNAGNNGSAQSAPSGGTSPYSYSWSGGHGSGSSATALTAGSYTVTITDNHGCTATATVTITQPTALASNATINTNVSCNGGNNGKAQSAPSGGTSPYTYSWSGSHGTNSSASGLTAGSYTVTVKDKNGCSATARVTITQPTAISTFGTVTSNVSCFGGNNGSTQSVPSNGTSPYTYSWSGGGGTNSTATGLTAGTYTLTVTDNNGCMATKSLTITQPTTLHLTRDSVKVTSECNGKAWVKMTGGVAPYTYSWSPGGETTDTIKNQCGGVYCVLVTDNHGCLDSACITILPPTGIANIDGSSSDIIIYPNPNNGKFTLAGLIKGEKIELYDYLDQKLITIISSSGKINLDISDKTDGVYMIRVTENGILVGQKKVVKSE